MFAAILRASSFVSSLAADRPGLAFIIDLTWSRQRDRNNPLECKPPLLDKAAEFGGLISQDRITNASYTKRCRRLDHSTLRLSRLPALC